MQHDLPQPVERATERLFCALSSARGRRILHPRGVAYRIDGAVGDGIAGTRVLRRGARLAGVVRFSRGLGLPPGVPDFLGLALSLEDDQDLLLASSSAAPALRFVPRPAGSFFGPIYSTLLPLSVDGRLVLIGARLDGASRTTGDPWDELTRAADEAVRIELLVASLGGRWQSVAELRTREPLRPEEARRLVFDPWRCAGGLVPWGWPNRLRAPAYRGSRRGRDAGRAGS